MSIILDGDESDAASTASTSVMSDSDVEFDNEDKDAGDSDNVPKKSVEEEDDGGKKEQEGEDDSKEGEELDAAMPTLIANNNLVSPGAAKAEPASPKCVSFSLNRYLLHRFSGILIYLMHPNCVIRPGTAT